MQRDCQLKARDQLETLNIVNLFWCGVVEWLQCRDPFRRTSFRELVIETLLCTFHIHARKIRGIENHWVPTKYSIPINAGTNAIRVFFILFKMQNA